MASDGKEKLHVAMFPYFAFGHISPFVQLSNKLALHGIKISFLSVPGNIPRIRSALHSSDTTKIIPLKIPAVDGLPPGIESTAEMTPQQGELLKNALDAMAPQIESLLGQLRPHIVFFDFAMQWLPSIASPLNIKTFFFSVFSAVSTAYITIPSRRPTDQNTIPAIEDLKRPPPGFPPTSVASLDTYEARDFSYVFMTFTGPSVFDRVTSCLKSCSAIVIKSCLEMEAPYIDFVKTQFQKPVLLAGPVVPCAPTGELDRYSADWLSRFEDKSVVLCSFGSETFLKDEQIRELVLGLEMTGAPFLVVLNFPKGEDSSSRLKSALPEGFEERVKGRGIVHVGWVQQLHILAHVSVGCFVCHSGLSSVTEALVHDCQLVLLPQKGDQFLNSKLVSGDLKTGVQVKRDGESGDFTKDDLCQAVISVMGKGGGEPGKSIRENHRKWREFLTNDEIHDKFTSDIVANMKTMVFGK